MSDKVIINDVGPRDGLQNQAQILSVDQRLEIIHSLVSAGVRSVEAGSFVSPKAVPAMAGTDGPRDDRRSLHTDRGLQDRHEPDKIARNPSGLR